MTISDINNYNHLLYLILERQFCQYGDYGKGKKDGNYAHPKHCDRFITCEHFEHPGDRNAKVTIQPCPYGLFYNSKIGVCDWPRNVDCFLYQGKTCFGAKGNYYGSFKASQTGYLRGIKLIHKDGYVTCNYRKSSYKSLWGCNFEQVEKKLNTYVTTTANYGGLIFPDYSVPRDYFGNYDLEGFSQQKPYIMFTANPLYPVKVYRYQELRVWYGEDLLGRTEYDNHGKHCIEIYASYSYYRPYYYYNQK